MFQKRAKIWLNIPKNGKIEAELPKYHISTARAKRSGASAWAWAHALSMVTWHHQNIVNGYHLIMFTHLFKAESAINDFILRSESSQNYLIFLFPREYKNKLGLRWAKLSSSWDWVLLQLICIINKNVPKMGQPSNNNNKDRNNINWLWILKMGWFWKFISLRSISC